MKIIGVEEHFATPDLIRAWQQLDPHWQDLSLRARWKATPRVA